MRPASLAVAMSAVLLTRFHSGPDPASAWQATQAAARMVLAAVVAGDGRPVVDVDADDFVVTEGGQTREVLDVHVADYPLAVVLDDRAQSAASLPNLRESARRFIDRVGERPISLLTLSGTGGVRVSLDESREVLLERTAAIAPAPTDATGALDVVADAASLLEASGAPFSAVIVIAAGSVDASAPVRGELLPRILESGATVHVVQMRDQAAPAAQPDDEADLLRVLAGQTRGQFTPIFSPASYQAALDRLADRLAIEMMVQYLVPPGPRAGDVRVGVRKPGARVVGLGVR